MAHALVDQFFHWYPLILFTVDVHKLKSKLPVLRSALLAMFQFPRWHVKNKSYTLLLRIIWKHDVGNREPTFYPPDQNVPLMVSG